MNQLLINYDFVSSPKTPTALVATCDRYKSIDIEVSISISILLRQSIDIVIDDTFKAGIESNIGDTFGKYR